MRRNLSLAVGVVVLVLAVVAFLTPPGTDPADDGRGAASTPPTAPGPTPTPAGPPPTIADLDAAALLDALLVADPDPDRPPYERDDWEEGLDADGDCLRTRHEVLAEESLVPPTVEDCHVVAGEWRDPLTGTVVTDPAELQVDHLVALADAHRSGGWRWDADRRAAYANMLDDPDHLNAVLGDENQRKADEGPEAYRPPDHDAWCWYGTAYARVKVTWGLTVTAAQLRGLEELLATCPAG